MTKAAIARHVGVSRDTIYRWIATGQLDRDPDEEAVRYRARPPVPSKLDPCKAIFEARLAEYPKLTATRLFKEVRDAGYPGNYSQVKRYVRRVRPRRPEEPVQRSETPPGHQGKVDFADFRLPWGKRHALIVVLGYSRLMWLRYYECQTMPVVMRGLETAFRYFGGVPTGLLFDQMKAVIIKDGRAAGGRPVENPEFLRFSHHWGFRIACRPYRAQTKGKVEWPIGYIRESFFYGRDFVSDDDLNARALDWLDGEANARVRGTLKERPTDRFQRERPHLTHLTPWPVPARGTDASVPKSEADPDSTGGAGRGRRPPFPGLVRPDHGGCPVKTSSRREHIAAQLADLKMPGALEALDEVPTDVDGGGTTAAEAIERLLAAQISLRNSRRLQTAMRSSRLPAIKTLADFDFSFQPSVKREQIDSLHEFGFVERKENVVFLGPPGVGKTHLAISLAIGTAQTAGRCTTAP